MTLDEAKLELEDLEQGKMVNYSQAEAIKLILERNKTLERALSTTYEEVGKLGAIL